MNLNPVFEPAANARAIAVVDDDGALRESTEHLLRSAGFRVHGFSSGDAFLSSRERNEVSGVILDLNMPGKSGLQVLREMGKGGATPPVVMFSGQASIPQAVMAMKTGAIDFIEKPCLPDELIGAVERVAKRGSEDRARQAPCARAAQMVAGLPQRLRQVLAGIAEGKLNKIIAHELGLSIRTVEAYRAQLMERLDVRGTAGAVRIAMAAGMAQANGA